MLKSNCKTGLLFLCCLIGMACNNKKPGPVSKDIAKTAVTVNGKKDSVINNPEKNYGSATVAEPCVKCLIVVVERTSEYKTAISATQANSLKYIVNWAEGTTKRAATNTQNSTNALMLDIIATGPQNHKLASFTFDNSRSKLFLLKNNQNTEVKIDSMSIQSLRNKCYWGVASSR